ncbi:MAG: FAD-binding oxidoreductase [Bacteroidetes bacterium]|nr:FAD-binding oxidoreductase [Bacteroidota bacterium]
MYAKKDIIIVGQGITGSCLSWQLLIGDKKIVVIDTPNKNISSFIAPGLYNPITGRSFQKTWLADIIFPYMENFYKQIENITNSRIIYPKNIFKPFKNSDQFKKWNNYNDFDEKYIQLIENHNDKNLKFKFGGIKIQGSGYVDIKTFLNKTREQLIALNSYLEEDFKHDLLRIDDNKIIYKNIIADKIIFCEGIYGKFNPFFKNLPFQIVKGEILYAKTNFILDIIYNREIFLLQNHTNKLIIGSTYERLENLNSNNEISKLLVSEKTSSHYLKDKVEKLFNLKIKYINHKIGLRPCTIDRRPFIGFHSKYKNIGILNGLGTKGVSLAPYMSFILANLLSNKLGEENIIYNQINIARKNCIY